MTRAFAALKALVEAEAAFDQNRADHLMHAAKVWAEARAALAEGEPDLQDISRKLDLIKAEVAQKDAALDSLRTCIGDVREALGCEFGQDMREVARCYREHSAAWLKLRAAAFEATKKITLATLDLNTAARQ